MKMWLTAEFSTVDSVAEAVSTLRAGGFTADEIELFSDRPVELPAGLLDRRSHISLLAVLGAIVNGGLATAFIFFTERNYRLITGGMPIISGWSTGVVSYELTMAGAMAGVVIGLLWEGRLLFPRSQPAPLVRQGSILMRVGCPDRLVTDATRCLMTSGALEITQQEAP